MTGRSGKIVSIEQYVALDLERGTKLIQFYIPVWNDTFNVCISFLDNYRKALEDADLVSFSSKGIGDSDINSSKDLSFAGRIFIYHESELTAEQLGDLTRLYKSNNLYVQLRSSSYLSFKKLQTTISNGK
jgi:hypothetical protein